MNILIPSGSKGSLGPSVSQSALGHAKRFDEEILAKRVNDLSGCIFVHTDTMTSNLSLCKTGDHTFWQNSCPAIIGGMDMDKKPFGDIALRIRWHRALEGLTQKEYGDKIGQKRANINNWESGDYRLSLDGALAIRKTYGLSLDFMYEGIDDALPMTLRAAWRERS